MITSAFTDPQETAGGPVQSEAGGDGSAVPKIYLGSRMVHSKPWICSRGIRYLLWDARRS